MKQGLKFVLPAIVLALIATAGMGDSVAYIPVVPTISVDGNTTDAAWQYQDWTTLAIPEDLLMGDATDAINCGLKVKLGHDENNLFVLGEITDQSLNPATWSEWWNGDFVGIGTSPNPTLHKTAEVSDRLIVIRPSAGSPMKVWRMQTDTMVDSGSCCFTNRPDGWAFECAVPLTELGAFALGDIGFLAMVWDIDSDVLGPNVIGSWQNAPMIIDGPLGLGTTKWSSWVARAKEVDGASLKQTTDDVPLSAKSLGWTVTKQTNDGFYCQDPVNRIHGIRVVGPEALGIAEGTMVWGLAGSLATVGAERVFNADSIDYMPAFALQPAPFGLNSAALGGGILTGGAPNLALRVRLTGTVKEVANGYFVVSDGSGRDIKIESDYQVLPATVVSITGVSSSLGGSSIILANSIKEVD